MVQKSKKKKTLAEKAREALSKYLPTKKPTKEYTMPEAEEGSEFGGTADVAISKMNRYRKRLEKSLEY